MKENVSKLLKLTFLIHFFVSVIFGLLFTVLVELYVGVIGWPYLDPVTGRVLGAVFLGLAAASLLSWRETKWESVKIVVQMEIVWLIIGTAVQDLGSNWNINIFLSSLYVVLLRSRMG